MKPTNETIWRVVGVACVVYFVREAIAILTPDVKK